MNLCRRCQKSNAIISVTPKGVQFLTVLHSRDQSLYATFSVYLPELEGCLAFTEGGHQRLHAVLKVLRQLCLGGKHESMRLHEQKADLRAFYTWIGGNYRQMQAIEYGVNVLRGLRDDTCEEWSQIMKLEEKLRRLGSSLMDSVYTLSATESTHLFYLNYKQAGRDALLLLEDLSSEDPISI